MKCKIAVVVLLMIMIVAVFAAAEDVETYTCGDYEYTLAEDGSAVISKYNGTENNLSIPPVLDGHPVRKIGDDAFFFCFYLSTVTIPDSVAELGDNPWRSCDNLSSIHVSPKHSSLAVIDEALYSKADKRLVWVPPKKTGVFDIPMGIRIIGYRALSSCGKLTSVTIPNSVTTIGEWAFSSCDTLSSIMIPGSVKTIGRGAFFSCRNLKSVTIQNGVTFIGSRAFDACTSLTSITIPDSVAELGDNPWEACFNLSSIFVSPNHPYLGTLDGTLYSKADKRLIWVSLKKTGTYEIPQGIRIIGNDAFLYSRLTSVTIPNSVTTISNKAFFSCGSLTSITIPDSVTIIGNEAFYGCENLTSIMIPDSVQIIDSGAFFNCEKLAKVTISGNTTAIGEYAFGRCPNLSLTVEEGSYAEQYCIDNGIPYTYDYIDTSWLND